MDSSEYVHRRALEIVGGDGGRGRFFRNKLNQLLSLRSIADYYPENVDQKELEDLLKDADCIRRHHIQISGGGK